MKTIKILVTCKVEDDYVFDYPYMELKDAFNGNDDIEITDCKYIIEKAQY